MQHAIIFPCLFLVGAVAGRLRGTGIFTDVEARYLIWGAPVGLLAGIAMNNFICGIVALILAGLGASLGYEAQFDLTLAANRNFKNYAILTATAMFRFFPLFLVSILVGWQWRVLPAVLAGVSFVPAYLLGIKVVAFAKLPLLQLYSEWGEFFFWGTIYTAFAAGMLYAGS